MPRGECILGSRAVHARCSPLRTTAQDVGSLIGWLVVLSAFYYFTRYKEHPDTRDSECPSERIASPDNEPAEGSDDVKDHHPYRKVEMLSVEGSSSGDCWMHGPKVMDSRSMETNQDQEPLRKLLVELDILLSAHNTSVTLGDDMVLISNVCKEVKAWCTYKGYPLACEAQIALAHSSGHPATTTSYIDWNKKPAEISLNMYMHLMRRTHHNSLRTADAQHALQAAIYDTESWLAAAEDKTTSSIIQRLSMLHEVGDWYIAYQSLEEAIVHIKAALRKANPSVRTASILVRMMEIKYHLETQHIEHLNQVIQTFIEYLYFFNDVRRTPALCILGTALRCRFFWCWDTKDLDLAIESLREAVDLAPLGSDVRAQSLSVLGSTHELRLKTMEFKDVDVCTGSYAGPARTLGKSRRAVPPLNALLCRLSVLLSLKDVRSSLRDDRILLCNVYEETKAWLSRKDTSMCWDAQITLAHSTTEGVATVDYIDWHRSPAEISVMMYLRLLQQTYDGGVDDINTRCVLQAAIQDAQEWLASTNSSASSDSHSKHLSAMQAVGDYSVACHSVVNAINHINNVLNLERHAYLVKSMLSRIQSVADFIDTDVPERLNQLIQTLTEFLMFVEGDERAITLAQLGSALRRRFSRHWDKRDIDDAIRRFDEAITVAQMNDEYRVEYLCDSADALDARYDRFGDVDDIRVAIDRFEKALSLTCPGSNVYLKAIRGLAFSLSCRSKWYGHTKDANRSIKLWREASGLAELGSPVHVQCLLELGMELWYRFRQLGKIEDIDSGISVLQEAYSFSPSSPDTVHRLGTALWVRFEYGPGVVEDINTAIAHLRHATELDPSGSPMNLGIALFCRYRRFGKLEDLDSAIEVGQKALDVTPLDHYGYPNRLSNLGNQLQARFERLKQRGDLDKALMHHRQALDLTPLDSTDRVGRSKNLATCLARRYDQNEDPEDLYLAIKLLQSAVDSCAHDNSDRCAILQDLGHALVTRFLLLGKVEDLEFAIQLHLEIVTLKSDVPDFHISLSGSLLRRYEHTKQLKDLDLAIKHSQIATVITPMDHRDRSEFLGFHGRLLLQRSHKTNNHQDYARTITTWKSACSSVYGEPYWRYNTGRFWAIIAHARGDLESAAEGYIQAIRLLPHAAWIGLGASSQLAQIADLNDKTMNLACDAAACLFSLADKNPHQREHYLSQAVELLDQGRSILWSQASQLRQDLADLRAVNPDLAQELEQVSQILSRHCFESQSLAEAEARAYRRSVQNWEEFVKRVRALPGFESFLLPLPISELRKSAEGGPIVIINASQYRFDALIMCSTGDLVLVPLPKEAIDSLSNHAYESTTKRKRVQRTGRPAKCNDHPLRTMLHKSWHLLGQPVVRQLTELGLLTSGRCRVWWCLTGSLSLHPIHAAHPPVSEFGKQPMGMMDMVISSYTPTVSALLRSRRSRSRALEQARILAIGQSADLPMVKEELDAIRKLVPPEQLCILESDQATTDTVSPRLKDYAWVHFACHGIQDYTDPMNSGLKMHDKLLTLSKLAQMSLPSADFAFLSCCQSASGTYMHSDESMHLAAGMQFVGFRSVIGTLWSVGDSEAKVVAEHVYKNMFGNGIPRPNAEDAALMLNHAVRYLRDAHCASPERWVPFVHFGV